MTLTARKWVAVDFGGPEVLRNVEVDVPEPGPGQVTIDVRAAGMNPADAKHSWTSLARRVRADRSADTSTVMDVELAARLQAVTPRPVRIIQIHFH